MVISNETLEIINYTKDLDTDYNIKLLLLIFLISLSIFLLWYSSKIERKTDISNMIYYITKIFSISVISSIPIYLFLLLRSVDLDILLTYIFVFYGVLLSISMLFVLWWAGQSFLKKFLGVDFSKKRDKIYRDKREYRGAE